MFLVSLNPLNAILVFILDRQRHIGNLTDHEELCVDVNSRNLVLDIVDEIIWELHVTDAFALIIDFIVDRGTGTCDDLVQFLTIALPIVIEVDDPHKRKIQTAAGTPQRCEDRVAFDNRLIEFILNNPSLGRVLVDDASDFDRTLDIVVAACDAVVSLGVDAEGCPLPKIVRLAKIDPDTTILMVDPTNRAVSDLETRLIERVELFGT